MIAATIKKKLMIERIFLLTLDTILIPRYEKNHTNSYILWIKLSLTSQMLTSMFTIIVSFRSSNNRNIDTIQSLINQYNELNQS